MTGYTNLKFIITPLTPLHIGSGDMMDPFRYLVKGGYAHLINTSAYTSFLSDTDKHEFMNVLGLGNFKSLVKYLWDHFDPNNSSLHYYRYPADKDMEDVFKRQLEEVRNQNSVHAFIRTGMLRPLIPGSSIKGSFRTAVINALYEKREKRDLGANFEFDLLGAVKEGKKKIDEDPFKLIRFSDAPLRNIDLMLKKIERVYTRVDRVSAPVYAELLQSTEDPVSSTVLSISTDFLKQTALSGILPPTENMNERLYALFALVNNFYKAKIEEDKAAITNPKHTTIYDAVLEKMGSIGQGGFILRIGKGSGQNFLSVSNPALKVPITKSVVDKQPMGWCLFQYTSK